MKKTLINKTKLTEADGRVVEKCQKACKAFNNLKNLDENSDRMVNGMPKLLKVFAKMKKIHQEQRDQIKILEDAGRQALNKVTSIQRAESTKRHNFWQNTRSPDVQN